jgi:hypothetical protein
VANLFQARAQPIAQFDTTIKQFVYRLMMKTNSDKASLTDLWRSFFEMGEQETTNSITNKPYLSSKDELK